MGARAAVPFLPLLLCSLYTVPTSSYQYLDYKTSGISDQQQELRSDLQRDLAGKLTRSVPREQNCPTRNEFDVTAAGMLCVRRCTVDTDCTNDRKLCLCDGLCGMSCIRPEKECPELPDPDSGQVTLGGRHFQVSTMIAMQLIILI